MARRTIFIGFRHAARKLWGAEGLAQCAERMSAEARSACMDPLVITSEMLPERFVLEWYNVAWEGPAQRDREVYNAFLDRMMDHGFGAVRKLLLRLATPGLVIQKCGELWRHDHTHGELTYQLTGPCSAAVVLSDHPYVKTALARSSIAEVYRYALSLSSANDARSQHHLQGEARLIVRLTWSR